MVVGVYIVYKYKHIYIYMREPPLGSISRFPILPLCFINLNNLHNLNNVNNWEVGPPTPPFK